MPRTMAQSEPLGEPGKQRGTHATWRQRLQEKDTPCAVRAKQREQSRLAEWVEEGLKEEGIVPVTAQLDWTMQNISLVLKLCLHCTPCPRFFFFLPCYFFSVFCVNSFPSVYSSKTRFLRICCLGFAPAHPWHSSVFNISVSILEQVILKATAYNYQQVPEVWVWTSPCVSERAGHLPQREPHCLAGACPYALSPTHQIKWGGGRGVKKNWAKQKIEWLQKENNLAIFWKYFWIEGPATVTQHEPL